MRGPRHPAARADWPCERAAVRRLTITLRSADQQARLERKRADLVSTVAHELRSPLTSVKGFTATLLSKWPRFTDDQKRVMLETVNADADRVTRLITELLDVSRIEAGRVEMRRQLVDLRARAERIVAGRVAAGDAASRFVIQVAGRVPETWLDADKVDQILANLIENAVRHGAGTVTTVIESALVHGEPGVAVSVRDQGPGIAPDCAPRVFRQFWRSKRRGGAGLGLFIVKGLVEAHGGCDRCCAGTGRRRRVPIYHARWRARSRLTRSALSGGRTGDPGNCSSRDSRVSRPAHAGGPVYDSLGCAPLRRVVISPLLTACDI